MYGFEHAGCIGSREHDVFYAGADGGGCFDFQFGKDIFICGEHHIKVKAPSWCFFGHHHPPSDVAIVVDVEPVQENFHGIRVVLFEINNRLEFLLQLTSVSFSPRRVAWRIMTDLELRRWSTKVGEARAVVADDDLVAIDQPALEVDDEIGVCALVEEQRRVEIEFGMPLSLLLGGSSQRCHDADAARG